MKNDEPLDEKQQVEEKPKSVLDQIIQEGARKLPQAAIENEIAEYIEDIHPSWLPTGCWVKRTERGRGCETGDPAWAAIPPGRVLHRE